MQPDRKKASLFKHNIGLGFPPLPVLIGFWIIICNFNLSVAQTDTAWINTFGGIQNDVCSQIKPTYDGGYITIGTTNSFCGGNSLFYIIKTDSLCHKQWSKAIGGEGIQGGYAVAPTYDHGYAFVGFTNSYGNGNYNTFLVKTDSAGNLKWEKTYIGTDWNFGYSIAQTPDSGFVICGLTYSYPAVNGDVYVIRTKKNGDTIWTRTIGGNGYDVGNSVCVHSKKLYAVVGATTSYGIGDTSMYIIFINDSGRVLKDTTYCVGAMRSDIAHAITEISDGGFLVIGNSDSLPPVKPMQVLYKTDSTAKIQWWYTYSQNNIGKDVAQAPDGSLVTTGTSQYDGLGYNNMEAFHLTNGNGYFLSGTYLGGTGDNFGNSIAIGKNGNVVFAGESNSQGFTQGLFDVMIARWKNADSVEGTYVNYVKNFKDSSECVLGIAPQSVFHPGVKVFPNPVLYSATFLVQGEAGDCYFLTIFNGSGKCIMQSFPLQPILHEQFIGHFQKGAFAAGPYFYEIHNQNGIIVASGKFIVQ